MDGADYGEIISLNKKELFKRVKKFLFLKYYIYPYPEISETKTVMDFNGKNPIVLLVYYIITTKGSKKYVSNEISRSDAHQERN